MVWRDLSIPGWPTVTFLYVHVSEAWYCGGHFRLWLWGHGESCVWWNPGYTFYSAPLPLFLQPSSWEGVFFLTFHQVTQLELGLCNPTVVEMEPGKEGRKSNVNFKAYSIVFFLTPSFVHLWERIQHFFSVELYLSYFVLLWRDTMISVTYRRKNLLGVYSFSRLEAMTIMGSMAAWRQAWCRSRSWELTPASQQERGREGGGEEREL